MCDVLMSIEKLILKAEDDLELELKSADFAEPKQTIEDINAFEDGTLNLLEEEQKHFLKEFDENDSIDNLIIKINTAKTTDLFKVGMASFTEDQLTDFTARFTDIYIKQIDKELVFNTFTDRTVNWIGSWSEELGDIMQLSSHNGIDRIMSKALKEGLSIQDTQQMLMDSYDFSRTRARTTAITEILTAHSVSKEEAFNQSPAVVGKKWKHTGGHKNKPRPEHVALDGVIVGKGKLFNVGGELALYPRDTNLSAKQRVLCHCTHSAVVDPEILGLTIEQKKGLQNQLIISNNINNELFGG